MLARRPAFRWLALGFLAVLPIALALVVRERASWKPRTLETGLVASHEVSVSRDGQQLALLGVLPGNKQMALQLWDLGSRSRLSSFVLPHKRFEKPLMSPDNSLVLCFEQGSDKNYDNQLRSIWIFNARSRKPVHVLEEVGEVAFVSDGRSFYAVNSRQNLSWDSAAPDVRRMDTRTLQVLEAHDVQPPHGLLFHSPLHWKLAPNSGSLAVLLATPIKSDPEMGLLSGVLLMDLRSGQRHVLPTPQNCMPGSVSFSRGDDLVAVELERPADNGLDNTLVQVWHRASGRLKWKWEVPGVWQMQGWTPDNSCLLMWGWSYGDYGDNTVPMLRDARSGRAVSTLRSLLERGAAALSLSPDGALLATSGNSSSDTRALLWDAHTGKIARRLFGHRAQVADVAWAPDGSTLATSSLDGTVKLWRVR